MASLHFILALALLWTSPGVRGAVNICRQDFGVESGVIPDASFSASSSATGREPHHARLNGNSAWCPGTGTGNQYLQIDLGLPVNVWGIRTQGDQTNAHNYVTNYYVHLSFNGVDFKPVKTVSGSGSITKVFTGNTNNNGIATVDLTTEYFSARYIRIIPNQSSGAQCLRVEIQGCAQYCPFALGIEDGSGPVLTASTSVAGSPPTSAKLGTSSAWCASSTNADQYLLVDLRKPMIVTGIAMQGSPTAQNWIKNFRVHFGVTSASSTLKNKNSNIFNGNVDQSSVVINWFSSPITARFVKIGVQDYNNQICARIELIGCSSADCVLPLGLESNVITDNQMTASSHYHINHRADRGRLNKLSKWCSVNNEAVTISYLQIDLGFVATVTGIMTQSDYHWAPNYVQTYQLSYDFDQSANTLRCVKNEGNNNCKLFTGNINGNGAVLNMFPGQAFSARVVRIRPQTRSGATSCLRVELYGCKQGFGASKGLQLGSQIARGVSVTSPAGLVNPPTFQLNGGTAWCPGAATGYLEVSFGGETMVAGVAIQGSPTTDSWVTKYRLWTRATIGAALSSVENDKEYVGSYNRESAVVNWLASPLSTTAIRITVVTAHTDACLRIEMYGLNSGCANPLPLTDGILFTASSIYGNNNMPAKGRLNSHPYAWVACYSRSSCQTDTTAHGWLQVCFSDFRTVSGAIIQGQGDQSRGAMRNFAIRYSYDGIIMNNYTLNGVLKKFIGNANRYEAVTRLFPKPVTAKCIRVVATERFPPNGNTSARIRLLGCDSAPFKPSVIVTASSAGDGGELNITLIGVDGFTGQIKGYEVILSTGNSSCSEITSAALAPETQFTSFTPEQIPYNTVVLKGIETVPGLDFVIPTPGNTSMCFRAFMESGSNIYYGAVESFQVERQSIKKPNSTSVGAIPTASSFTIELAQGLPTTSFYQVVVIEMLPGEVVPPFVPSYYQNKGIFKFNTTSHNAGTAYITGEFPATSFNQMKRFTVGDGKTYPLNNRRRRSTSSGEQFINVALSPDSHYAVFQVAVSGSGSSQVSPWSSIVATALADIKDPPSNVGVIIAGIIAALAVLIAVIVLIICLRRKAGKKDQFPVGNDNIALGTQNLDTTDGEITSNVKAEQDSVETNESGFNEMPLSQRQPPSTVETDDCHPVIPVNAFAKFNETMRRDGMHGFTEEYKELNSGQLYTWDTATLQKNKPKNRYANIVPYDHSIVTKSAEGSKKKLYINASFIDGYSKSKVYIAAQGPMPNTVDDFWELVWTEQVPAIIMATNVIERGKRKCEEYWPSKKPKTYRDITVVPIKEECYVEYTIRRFTLQKGGESCEVYQFHFFGWPDFGVPEFPTDVLNFHRRFRAVFPYDNTSRPIIIHCSAGVGRTGTFIGIDAMIELAKTKQIVDVYNFVNFMRSRRISMVQTEDQYIFIYSALFEAFTCGSTEIPTNELVTKLKSLASYDEQAKKSGYQKQFERLQFLTPHVKPSYYSEAKTKQNMARNRFEDILPRDDCRVILQHPLHEDDNTDYINAVYTNGYKKRDAFITTQHPLDTTINDFWFMVLQKEASTIVMLNKVKEEGDLYPVFWPSDGMTVEYGKVVVKCTSEKSMASTTQLMLNVSGTQASTSESKACAMLQYQDWPDHGVPANKSAILALLLQIEKSQQMHDNGPIIVICSDGAGRSGSLIAVSVALERVKVEQLVDIFQTVKKIRLARPQYVENKEQFKFCHDMILTYLDSFETYSNFTC